MQTVIQRHPMYTIHSKTKTKKVRERYRRLLKECLEIETDNFPKAVEQINEIASGLLPITYSSIWIVHDMDKTLKCADLYSKPYNIHKKPSLSIPCNEASSYLQRLAKEKQLFFQQEDSIPKIYNRHFQRHNIHAKLDAAFFYKNKIKGILSFETTLKDNFLSPFVYEVASTLVNILEISINLQYKKENETIFNAILENPQTGLFIFRRKILFCNEAAVRITEYSPQELKKMHTWDFVSGELKEIFKQRVLKRIEGEHFNTKYDDIPIRTKSGRHAIIRASVDTIMYEGEYAGIAIITDVTDLVKTKKKLQLLAQAVEQMDELVKITDPQGQILYVNNSLIANTGYKEIELIGQTPRIFKSGKHPRSFYKDLWDTITAKKIYRNVLINKKKDGTLYYEDLTISPMLDEKGEILYFVATSKDVSKQIELEEKLKNMATRDALTGIYNRYKMNEEIDAEIKKSKRYNQRFSILMFDIDFFKQINDTYGHDIGDKVLVELCENITKIIRDTDIFARWGGEEFIILARETNEESTFLLAEKIRKKVASHIFVQDIHITISIGAALFMPTYTKEEILKNVDNALYEAKRTGRNKTVLFQ